MEQLNITQQVLNDFTIVNSTGIYIGTAALEIN